MSRSSVYFVVHRKMDGVSLVNNIIKINFLAMTLKTVLTLLTVHVVILISCSKKEKSLENSQDIPNLGNDNTAYGWAYTGNSTNFSGCIDTAYRETNQSATVLAIEGTDSANNAFLIAIGSPNGNLATGTYSEIQGAGMILTDKDGNTFYSKTISLNITSISSNEVSAEFSASFTDDPATNNTVYSITGGKLKAVIGGDSPCE